MAAAAQAGSPGDEPNVSAAGPDMSVPESASPGGLQDVRLTLDPNRVQWRVMQLKARKLFMSASTRAQLDVENTATVRGQLITVDQGDAVMPGSQVVSLRSSTRYFGRESRLQLLMAPDDAQAYQYVRDSGGDRAKHRIYRYTDTGIFLRTHRPADKAQKDQPWESWTDVSPGWRPIAPAAYDAPIVEPLGILYAVSAADLSPGREPLEFLSISDKKVTRVTLSAHPAEPRKVDFELNGPDGAVRCRGEVPAIRLELDGQPVESGDSGDFEFLGLQDDVNIYVEPQSRLVLEVSGDAPIVGHVVIRLQEATLTSNGGCPAA